MIRFHISDSLKPFEPEIRYALKLWAVNQSQEIDFTTTADDALTIGTAPLDHLRVAHTFGELFTVKRNSPFIRCDGSTADTIADGDIDLLASAFYMVNALQEYDSRDLDELQRYPYKASYQKRLGNASHNLVQECFDNISRQLGVKVHSVPTKFFLSHDIDLIYSAIIEDGYNVIRRGRFDIFLKMLFNLAMGRPEWLNMDQIMKLESAHDCKSIFFWIVNKGRINQREVNADYRFQSRPVQRNFAAVGAQKFENGIHKSLGNDSFREEFAKYGNVPYANRYHYLKFRLPQAWHDIEAAGLKLDASLGFSAEMGFRNSYGLPFNPYNFTNRRAFSFVEAPLHLMDRTFFQYRKQSPEAARDVIFDFFRRNSTNCVLSVLWHNNFFTDYKFRGYLALYKEILAYISDNKFRSISAREIIQQYTITP